MNVIGTARSCPLRSGSASGRRFADDEVRKAVAEAETLLRGKAERDSRDEFPW
jgi:hypothetical protein